MQLESANASTQDMTILRIVLSPFLCFFLAMRDLLDDIERDRDEKNSDAACRQHPSDDHRPHHLPGESARSAREGQGQAAEDEGKRRHQDWPQSQTGPFQGS